MKRLNNVSSAEKVPTLEEQRAAAILEQGTRVDAGEFLKMLMSRDAIERVVLSTKVPMVAARKPGTDEWFVTDEQELMEAGAVQEILTTQ